MILIMPHALKTGYLNLSGRIGSCRAYFAQIKARRAFMKSTHRLLMALRFLLPLWCLFSCVMFLSCVLFLRVCFVCFFFVCVLLFLCAVSFLCALFVCRFLFFFCFPFVQHTDDKEDYCFYTGLSIDYEVRRLHSPDGVAQIAQPRWRHVNCTDGSVHNRDWTCEWRWSAQMDARE